MASKKVVAAKPAKKVPAPKPAKVAKPNYSLVSFSVSAVIPTQQYGNIQPKIEVVAKTIQDARAVVMPMIEDLYKTYAEAPLSGREPKFYGKVVETVKTVAPTAQAAPMPTYTPGPTKEQVEAQQGSAASTEAPAAPQKPKSEAVLKAEKAISLALTGDAAERIQEQIVKSTKIAEEDKPDLITLVLKKRGELK